MTERISEMKDGIPRSRRALSNGPVVLREGPRVIMIGTLGPNDFE
jgi:hypothetical protein